MKKPKKIKAKMLKGRKRISLPAVFLRTLVISVLLTFVFYPVFNNYLKNTVWVQVCAKTYLNGERIRAYFEKVESDFPENKDKITYLNSKITIAVDEVNKISLKGLNLIGVHETSITPHSVGYDVTVTVSPEEGTAPDNLFDDTYLVSNKRMFTAELEFGKDSDDNGIYVCPVYMKGVPETEQIYKDYRELIDSARGEWSQATATIKLDSVYCNKKTGVFIPHEGKIILNCFNSRSKSETIEKEIHLDLPDTGSYELVQSSEGQYYPNIRAQRIYGTDPEIIENIENRNELHSGYSAKVFFEKQKYDIKVDSFLDINSPFFVMIRRRASILFFIVSFFVVFVFCWRKYTLNKAECYYEDYRRDMTGHLAHDIKTPLMAISGYAENLMETDPDDEKRKKYLDSIMGNVEFTKKLIERTAVLNSMENNSGKPDKEIINIEETLKSLFDKYSLMFNERQIEVVLNGNATVKANRERTESLLENLVSNAVKYTAENGTLKAEISPKKLIMTNTVSEMISTKDLKRPFVRGDSSRSNTRGTGLGLSIAESAAQLNGFRLKIRCTDKEFVSEIIF